ncbi:hypothetical protein [Mycolicibacterium iranicum]|nr:hypothetical protein [Mycolicibacterium iranicum]
MPTIARQAHTDADKFWHLAGAWGRAAGDHRHVRMRKGPPAF